MTEIEQKLFDALRLALHALNEIPNSAIRHDKYRTSYEVAAVIGLVLDEASGGRTYLGI